MSSVPNIHVDLYDICALRFDDCSLQEPLCNMDSAGKDASTAKPLINTITGDTRSKQRIAEVKEKQSKTEATFLTLLSQCVDELLRGGGRGTSTAVPFQSVEDNSRAYQTASTSSDPAVDGDSSEGMRRFLSRAVC